MNSFTLPPKVYDIIKFLVLVVLPGVSTLYITLGTINDWDNVTNVSASLAAVATFLGSLVGLSARNYNNSDAKFAGDVVVTNPTPGVTKMELQLNDDVHVLKNKDELTFKVIGPESIS